MGLVNSMTTETTWALQFNHGNSDDGDSWHYNDQGEWTSAEEAVEIGNQMFGGGAVNDGWCRLVRIDRTPMVLVDGELVEVDD